MFNDDYGLTQAVLDGRKTMTRRIIKCPRTFRGEWVAGFNVHIRQSDKKIVDYPCMYDADGREFDGGEILPKYKIGEVVAIAQSYKDAGYDTHDTFGECRSIGSYPGWKNKRFVKAEYMPRHISITNIKIERLQDISDDIKLRYVSYAEDGTGTYTYLKNGINNLPISYKKFTGFAASVVGACNITITQLPSAYEDALVFDGVDDYGVCTGLPILDDYTVICRREIINKDYYSVASKSTFFGKGAFIFELIQNRTNHCYSFAADNQISLHNSEISWQTKNSYNGSTITVGNADDTDTLTLGIIRVEDESRRFLKGAIYYFALYNKSLTPEEVEEEKVKLENYWEGGKNELA